MGNRCILTLENDKGEQHPVALYLHWNGGLESVLAFIQYTWDTYPRGHGDLFTFHARLCQVLGNFFPDGMCLYGHPLENADGWAEGCDNGRFHFTIGAKAFELKGRAAEVEQAKLHKYWTEERNIFASIKDAMPKAEVVA
ncbi:hypothetical protein DLM45_01550 [Hyphomicrobium methylovorum]|uniref:hypothetical protein n=1 Tax=Hyphomicrobium methylovorum TaxID=84 RepID=UPI0015E77E92|nr:hypothetical protein [Hyphomicrobium methylovorum]MBA2124910.1 hypothetical protein [Hyphomicrobium methylovorum]